MAHRDFHCEKLVWAFSSIYLDVTVVNGGVTASQPPPHCVLYIDSLASNQMNLMMNYALKSNHYVDNM